MSYFDEIKAKGLQASPDDPFAEPPSRERPWFDAADIAWAVPRGAAGALKGAYNLVDTVAGDALPDWDANPFGESKSVIGGFVEGAAHFTAGFIPFGGGLGFAGLLGKAAQGASALSKAGRIAAASGLAGFTAFEGHEQRLSDLVQRYPSIQNPITAFLSSNKEDPELLGRLKNAIEQAGLGAATEGIILGVKAVFAGRGAKNAALVAGKTAEEADVAGTRAASEVATPDAMIAALNPEAVQLKGAAEAASLGESGVHVLPNEMRLRNELKGLSPDEKAALAAEAQAKYPDLPPSEGQLKVAREQAGDLLGERRVADVALPEGTPERRAPRLADDLTPEQQARTAESLKKAGKTPEEIAAMGGPEAKARPPEPEPIPGVTDDPEFAGKVPFLRRLGLDADGIKKFVAAYRVKGQAIEDVLGAGAGLPGETAFNPRKLSSVERAELGLLASDLPMQNFRTLEDANVFMRTAEDFFRAEAEADFKALAPTTLAKVGAQAAAQNAEMLGLKDLGTYMAVSQARGGKTLQSLTEAVPSVVRDRFVLKTAARHTADTFKTMKKIMAGEGPKGVSAERVQVDFAEAVQQMTAMRAIVSGEKNKAGLLLRVLRDDVPGMDLPPELSKLFDDPEHLQKVLSEVGGSQKVMEVMLKYEKAWNLAGDEGAEAALHKLSRGTLGRRFLDMTTEYFMGSVLSSPQTWVINGASNTLAQLFLPLERAMGSSAIRLSGGRLAPMSELALQEPILRESLAQITGTKRAIVDTFRLFRDSGFDPEAFRSGASLTDQGTRQAAITARNLGLKPNTWQAAMVDWVGSVVRIPLKILGGTDVVAKGVYNRSAGFARLQTEAMELGLKDPLKIAQYAEDRLAKLVADGQMYSSKLVVKRAVSAMREANITDPFESQKFISDYYAKNFDPKLAALSNELIRESDIATWTNRAPPGTITYSIQAFVNAHPALKLVAPFVNTPMNLLKGAGQRVDAIGVSRYIAGRVWPKLMPSMEETSNRFLQDMLSGNARRAADAVGRISLGTGAAVFFTSEALAGNITGRGPSDPNRRQALMDTGWQPYSFKVGDGYISYQRLDPFATIIGAAADMAEYMNHAEDVDDEDHATAITGLAIGIANNATNKSYLTGFANMIGALQAPEKKLPEFFNRQAAAFVPNILGTAGYGVGQDPNLREVNGFIDSMMAKIPYFSKQLPPRRNILGEPLERPRAAPGEGVTANTLLNLWDPIKYSSVKDDVVRNEFAALGHAWEPPKRRTDGVDLMEVPSGETNAYDRWQELQGTVAIGGMTLKDALRWEIKSNGYRKLTPEAVGGFESPRVERLSRIVNDYRARAWAQMLKETPALKAHDTAYTANKHRLRAGLPAAIIPGL